MYFFFFFESHFIYEKSNIFLITLFFLFLKKKTYIQIHHKNISIRKKKNKHFKILFF
jgi:hypothetical protein